jgi:hypothetical protein
MTSGVYELKFANGHRYIGKSINIETRWKQHYDKFLKGTAARNMQDAYNRYGTPKGDILLECHPDHIDIMEAVYIARHNPELNSDRPADPFPGVDIDYYIKKTDYLTKSTYEHMVTMSEDWDTIRSLKSASTSLAEQIEELEELNDELLVVRDSETIRRDISGKLKLLTQSNKQAYIALNNANQLVETLKKDLEQKDLDLAHLREPWWKRWFS